MSCGVLISSFFLDSISREEADDLCNKVISIFHNDKFAFESLIDEPTRKLYSFLDKLVSSMSDDGTWQTIIIWTNATYFAK